MNPNTLWGQFQANILKMVGAINITFDVSSECIRFNGHLTGSYRNICMEVTPQSIWIHCNVFPYCFIPLFISSQNSVEKGTNNLKMEDMITIEEKDNKKIDWEERHQHHKSDIHKPVW